MDSGNVVSGEVRKICHQSIDREHQLLAVKRNLCIAMLSQHQVFDLAFNQDRLEPKTTFLQI